MQSQRLSRILVLALATSQLQVSYVEPHTAQYRFGTPSNWEWNVFEYVLEFQTDFLDGAGADTFTVKEIGYCFIEVSITGSLRALQRAQDSYCVKDLRIRLHPFDKITCLTELPSEEDNPRRKSVSTGPIWKKKMLFVCIKRRIFLQMIAESVWCNTATPYLVISTSGLANTNTLTQTIPK